MRTYIYISGIILTLLLTIVSCSDIEYKYPEYSKSNGKEINNFEFTDLGLVGKKVGDNEIAITTLRTYDITPLKNIVPSFTISAASTITPSKDLPQDFTDTVYYKVTSELGETKEWKVYHKYRDFTKAGIGEVDSLWFVPTVDLALPSANVENSIGVIGDYFVLSRTGLLYDRFTGKQTGKRINKEGMVLGSGTIDNSPFIFANDDAGNLIGSLLGAWTKPYFRVYKWESADQPPTLILEYQAKEEPIGGVDGTTPKMSEYGRKLTVTGDVTKEAMIGSYNIPTSQNRAIHDFWGISNGQFNGKTDRVSTGYPGKLSNNYYQLAYAAQTDKALPYFFSDYNFIPNMSSSVRQTTLRYVYEAGEQRKETIIRGPLLGHEQDAGEGWGGAIMHSIAFEFYNQRYIAVLHAIKQSYFISIVKIGANPESAEDYEIVFHSPHATEEVVLSDSNHASINGNGTAGLTVCGKEDKDGVTRMQLYAYMTSTGVLCYEFNNYAPEE